MALLEGVRVVEVATFVLGPAPEIGEHTLEVLGEPGYGAERIEALRREGAIGAA